MRQNNLSCSVLTVHSETKNVSYELFCLMASRQKFVSHITVDSTANSSQDCKPRGSGRRMGNRIRPGQNMNVYPSNFRLKFFYVLCAFTLFIFINIYVINLVIFWLLVYDRNRPVCHEFFFLYNLLQTS